MHRKSRHEARSLAALVQGMRVPDYLGFDLYQPGDHCFRSQIKHLRELSGSGGREDSPHSHHRGSWLARGR